MIFFKMHSGKTPETNLYEIALKDEVKLAKELAITTEKYRRNKCTFGDLDEARSNLINHLVFMTELENKD